MSKDSLERIRYFHLRTLIHLRGCPKPHPIAIISGTARADCDFLNILRQHRCCMLSRQRLIFRGIVPDGEVVVVARLTVEVRSELPKLVHGNSTIENRLLPLTLDFEMMIWSIGTTILFENDRFARGFTHRVMLRDPGRAPGVVVAPRGRVEMESALYLSARDSRQIKLDLHSPMYQS